MALAALFWALVFAWGWGNFWGKISLAVLILVGLSFWLRPPTRGELVPTARDWAWGLGAAAALWLLFWLGKAISQLLFPFAEAQVAGIYAQGAGTPAWLVVLVLLFITGPGEELFWRRYVQWGLMRRLGPGRGWLLACLLYAGVHLPSGNFMLIGAAGVAGAFWGLLYWKLGRIAPVALCHIVWSAVIFVLLPVP